MMWRKTPAWVLVGGAWLAFVAGFVNAIGFLSAAHSGLTHVTGQVTQVSLTLRDGDLLATARAAAMVLSFFAGAVLTGVVVRSADLGGGLVGGRRYGVALLIEGALLFVAAWLARDGRAWSHHLVACAAGMQNALATSYSGAVIRTTHMTGIVTDLGLVIGHALRGAEMEWGRVKLLSLLLFAFFFGGALGAVSHSLLGGLAMFLAATGITVAGTAWLALYRVGVIKARKSEPELEVVPPLQSPRQ